MGNQDGTEWARNLVEQLWEELEAHPKTMAALTEAAGVNPNYPRLRREKGTMDLRRFCSLAHASGTTMSELVSKALDAVPTEDLVVRPRGNEPAIVQAARLRAAGDSSGAVLRAYLQRMDELRYDDPVKACSGIEAAIDHVEPADAAFALGVYASCCRSLLRLTEGWFAISAALELAARDDQGETRANLMQRAASLHRERCHYVRALAMSERATLEYVRLGDRRGIAQTLVDQGPLLARLGRIAEAESSLREGLKLLGEDDRRHRCAAHHALAVLLQYQGKDHEALEPLTKAAALAGSRVEKGKLQWLSGRCLAGLGRTDETLEAYDAALDLLMSIAPADASLLICDKAHVLLDHGRYVEASECAQVMRRLIIPLEQQNPKIAAAALELASVELESDSRLSLALVSDVRERIQKENQRRPPVLDPLSVP